MRRAVNGGLGESGLEARLVTKRGGGVVIRVATLPVRQDDDPRTQPAQYGGQLEAVFVGVLHVSVGQVECLAVSDVEDARGCVSLGLALVGRAAGATLAAREIEDGGLHAERVLDQEGAAAGLLDIVTVGGDSEYVDR